jgi:hypothetical protein
VFTAGALEKAGWESRCEHKSAITFPSRALLDSAAGRAIGVGLGCPGESILRKISALTLECKAPGKDDEVEDEFASDNWTALPLLPSSSDELVSILLKVLME